MDRQEATPMVLAHIPDLSAVVEKSRSNGRRPTSRGRVIGQALSFKLLAVAVVLLVALAMVPWTINRNGSSVDSPTPADSLPAWNPGPPTPSANVAAVHATPLAEAAKPTPASPSPTPRVFPQPKVVSALPVSASASAPTVVPQISPWPSPDHPISPPETASEDLRTDVDQAMATRPSEQFRNTQ
jgi:hypothetical protein